LRRHEALVLSELSDLSVLSDYELSELSVLSDVIELTDVCQCL